MSWLHGARRGLVLRPQQAVAPPSPPPSAGRIWPSANWTGVAASGYLGSPPVDPTRTTAKAIIRELFIPYKTFAADYDVVFEADAMFEPDALGGISYVRIYCEGNVIDVAAPQWWSYTNANGGTSWRYGYGATLDYAATMALNPTGAMDIYAEAVPLSASVQNRVMGPYRLYARAPGVGASSQYDIQLIIDPTLGSDTAGASYRTLDPAALYCKNNGKLRPLLLLNRSTTYRNFTSGVNRSAATDKTLYTIAPGSGVNAVIGDYTTQENLAFCDGQHWMNANGGTIKWLIDGMATKLPGLGAWRGANGSLNLLIMEGIEQTYGNGASLPTPGSGAGSTLMNSNGFQPGSFYLTSQIAGANYTDELLGFRLYWLDCNIHDMAAYGVMRPRLLLNTVIRNVSGSAVENMMGAMQGNQISHIGGVQSGHRVHTNAFTMTFTGSGAGTFERRTSGPSGAGLYWYEDGVQVGYVSIGSAGNVNLLESIVTFVNNPANGLSARGWSASLSGTCPKWNAIYVSKSSLAPSSVLSLTTVGATPVQFTGVIDVHSDAIVFDNGNHENRVVSFNTVYDNITTAGHTLVIQRDASIHNNIFQDTSITNGYAAQTTTLGGGAGSHLLYYHNTVMGTGNNVYIPASQGVNWDAFCRAHHNVAGSFSYQTSSGVAGTDPEVVLTYCVGRTGFAPAGIAPGHYVNCIDLASVAESTMYTDPVATPPDATPKAPLLTGSGKYAGAKALASTATNRGWNLPAA